jgi:hypothetical protein
MSEAQDQWMFFDLFIHLEKIYLNSYKSTS